MLLQFLNTVTVTQGAIKKWHHRKNVNFLDPRPPPPPRFFSLLVTFFCKTPPHMSRGK